MLSTLIDLKSGVYHGSFFFSDLDFDLRVEEVGDPYDPSAPTLQCVWWLRFLDRDTQLPVDEQRYPVVWKHTGCGTVKYTDSIYPNADEGEYADSSYTDLKTCHNPRFTFRDPSSRCPGTNVIERFDLIRQPFVSTVDPGEDPIVDLDDPCGLCTEIWRRVCVEYTIDAVTKRREFAWDTGEGLWRASCSDDSIALSQDPYEYQRCEVVLDIADFGNAGLLAPGSVFNSILLESCAEGILFQAENEYGNSIVASCNPCQCWDYVCGTCRCVCPSICYFRQDYAEDSGGTSIPLSGIYKELLWDSDTGAWTDGYDIVTLVRTCDGCGVSIAGYDIIEVEKCGKDFGFFAEKPDGSTVSGACKWCGECPPPFGCCGDRLLPKTLYADLISSGDCATLPQPCLPSQLSVPLIWTPHIGVEGYLHRWIGHIDIDWFGTELPCGIRITVFCLPGNPGLFWAQIESDHVDIILPIAGATGEFSCNPVYMEWDGWLNHTATQFCGYYCLFGYSLSIME